MSTRHWHILGAGAIGTLVRAACDRAGIDATLLTHHHTRQQRQFSDHRGMRRFEVLPLDEVTPGSVQLLLLTTKAYALQPALQASLSRLHADAAVIVCANGRGFEDDLRDLLGDRPLYRALTTEGALRSTESRVEHTGSGRTLVGGGPCPEWLAADLGALPDWQWQPDLERAVDDKFALNCAINALTALHRCRNGELLDDAARRAELRALCGEIQSVLQALGRWQDDSVLLDLATAVCRGTAANQSSMLQDRLAGRRTELRYLNEYLLALAEQADVPVPRNQALVRALRAALEND